MGRIILIAVIVALLWIPLLKPLGQAAIVVADLYAPVFGSDLSLGPAPRIADTREAIAGEALRVTWFVPAQGERHPAMLVVNGATPNGNDDPITRRLCDALARGGWLVMLPEFPFLVTGRLSVAAPSAIASAFAALRARPEVDGERVSAFGSSVGAGLLLAAAGREPALARADALVILGSYYDLDTYLASVVTRTQRRDGLLAPWPASEEVKQRLPAAVLDALSGTDRDALARALAADGYDRVTAALAVLPRAARALLDGLSPRTTWSKIAAPIYWLHDPNDTYEPVAEAERARDASPPGRLTLAEPGLVSHAAPVTGPISDLLALVGFALAVMRASN
ncbi:MAG: hypothetical protein HY071_06420 [Chloroflexi bacterium]|nr:hypothetical protein [Chloroflexota bacterium]